MNLYFSDRLKLEKEFLAYAEKNNIKNCPQSVIGWIQNKIRARDKQEAINRVNNCCPNDNIGGTPLRKNKRCEACERDIWFYDLTAGDLK